MGHVEALAGALEAHDDDLGIFLVLEGCEVLCALQVGHIPKVIEKVEFGILKDSANDLAHHEPLCEDWKEHDKYRGMYSRSSRLET